MTPEVRSAKSEVQGRRHGPALYGLIVCALVFGGCSPTIKYQKPGAPQLPAAFKENWQSAQPSDVQPRGAWWEIFQDPQLNGLEAQIDVSNTTLRINQARFLQARAQIGINRSSRYPQVTFNPQITRGDASGNRVGFTAHQLVSDFLLPADVSYELDAWGRIGLTIEAARTTAQASAADLETVRLSLHSELAQDYFQLRSLDAERSLLDNSVDAFQKALELTQNRFAGGIASAADVALAETELETTRAQAVDIEAERATLEHAIAILVGKAPSALQIAASPVTAPPPDVPSGLPSQLLERRPDIAAAERRVAAATANLGVANAAFFPRLFLTASAGFESRSLLSWLSGLSSFWSAGPAAAFTVFDAGRRRSLKEQAAAAVDESVANYQDVILRSLQDVEDNLSTLRILRDEADIQARAVDAANRSLALANNRYRGGVATYLEVITAQNAALTNQRAAVSILSRRLSATILLIKAIGGGWNVAALPTLR